MVMSTAFADIALPTWVVVSQWILLFALGGLVIVVYRQLAYVLQLRDLGSEQDGLPIGEKAPTFDHVPVNAGASAFARFEPTGQWSLLMFADPGCESCRGAVAALGRLAPKLRQVSQVLVVTRSEPALIAAVDAFAGASVAIGRVDAEVPDRLYRTHTTPFVYVSDPEGVIRAKGIAGDEPGIRKIVHKADSSAIEIVSTAS